MVSIAIDMASAGLAPEATLEEEQTQNLRQAGECLDRCDAPRRRQCTISWPLGGVTNVSMRWRHTWENPSLISTYDETTVRSSVRFRRLARPTGIRLRGHIPSQAHAPVRHVRRASAKGLRMAAEICGRALHRAISRRATGLRRVRCRAVNCGLSMLPERCALSNLSPAGLWLRVRSYFLVTAISIEPFRSAHASRQRQKL